MVDNDALTKAFHRIYEDKRKASDCPVCRRVEEYWRSSLPDESEVETRMGQLYDYFGHGKNRKENCRAYFRKIGQPSRADYQEQSLGRRSQRNRTDLNKLRLLNYAFDIPLHIFGAEIAEYEFQSRSNPDGRLKLIENRLLSIPETTSAKRTYSRQYSNSFIGHIERSVDYLYTYSFLGRNNKIKITRATDLESYYAKAHASIFHQIETKLHSSKKAGNAYEYIRVLALPPSTRSLHINRSDEAGEIVSKCAQALVAMGIPVVKHICRCLKDNLAPDAFWICYVPYRLYHYGLVGLPHNKVLLVSEYYKYKQRGDYVPDILFVEEDNRPPYFSTDLVELYHNEIDKILSKEERAFRITAPLLIRALKSAYAHVIKSFQKSTQGSKESIAVERYKLQHLVMADKVITEELNDTFLRLPIHNDIISLRVKAKKCYTK